MECRWTARSCTRGFTSYLTNAEQASGKTYEDFALALKKSGLKSHGDLRSLLMDTFGLGHGHANAVVHIWREHDGGDALIGAAPAKAAAEESSQGAGEEGGCKEEVRPGRGA